MKHNDQNLIFASDSAIQIIQLFDRVNLYILFCKYLIFSDLSILRENRIELR